MPKGANALCSGYCVFSNFSLSLPSSKLAYHEMELWYPLGGLMLPEVVTYMILFGVFGTGSD